MGFSNQERIGVSSIGGRCQKLLPEFSQHI